MQPCYWRLFRRCKVGSCKFSDISVFSFHPVKIITTGEGGAITTNRKDLYQKMLSLRSHGITKQAHEFAYQKPGNWYYEQQMLGFNYRLTDIQAALGLSQLRRLDDIIIERQNFAKTILICCRMFLFAITRCRIMLPRQIIYLLFNL